MAHEKPRVDFVDPFSGRKVAGSEAADRQSLQRRQNEYTQDEDKIGPLDNSTNTATTTEPVVTTSISGSIPNITKIDGDVLDGHMMVNEFGVGEDKKRKKRISSLKPRQRTSKRELHWVTRKAMVGCLTLAFSASLGHHFYYNSLIGYPAGGSFEQQRTRL
jgi:hypothetical protein